MEEFALFKTQEAIKFLKDNFETLLAKKLNLLRVSAPLFVLASTGYNDELSGKEERVSFSCKGEKIEIVQSLAKWKRHALKEYGFPVEKGLYTDMNAIRKDENMDALHSIYVDQWDWEKQILPEQRNKKYLFQTVKDIYAVIVKLAHKAQKRYGFDYNLPKHIHFISTQELENEYPNLTPKQREYEATKRYRAVFLFQIGWPLDSGVPHDDRASDYDDWTLNGDILVHHDALDCAFELSSMGIRVNKEALLKQIEAKKEQTKLSTPYCQSLMNDELPLTIGGGIGQSRLCMFYLQKKHIGEVQSSYWPENIRKTCKSQGIKLL